MQGRGPHRPGWAQQGELAVVSSLAQEYSALGKPSCHLPKLWNPGLDTDSAGGVAGLFWAAGDRAPVSSLLQGSCWHPRPPLLLLSPADTEPRLHGNPRLPQASACLQRSFGYSNSPVTISAVAPQALPPAPPFLLQPQTDPCLAAEAQSPP